MIAALLQAPQRYDCMQAVRIVLRWLRDQGVAPDEALQTHIRFHNSLSLAFPASQIEALSVEPVDGGAPRVHITPAFLGLLGVAGALPLHYTVRIANQALRHKDWSARDFFDQFSTRMLALAFQAWEKYRMERTLDPHGADALLPLLHALAGATQTGCAGRHVGPRATGYYAAALRQRPLSAQVIERVLSDYLGVPVALEQFVGAWETLPAAALTRLGTANCTLGESGMLGVRRWRQDRALRVHIGPLHRGDLERFLPGSAGIAALEELLGLFAMPDLRYEAQLILLPDCIEPVVLGGAAMQKLGWNTYLTTTAATAARSDTRFRLTPRWSAAGAAPA